MGVGIRVQGCGIWGLRVGDCGLAIAACGLILGGGIGPRLGLVLASESGIRGSGIGLRCGAIIVTMTSATQIGFPSPELRIPSLGVFLNP